MEDFLIDDANVHLLASKNLEYRQQVRERFSTFIQFLQTNGLTTRTLLPEGSEVTSETKIMKSDLTSVGFQVVKLAYDKWLRGIDKGKPVSDVRVLQTALEKVNSDSLS